MSYPNWTGLPVRTQYCTCTTGYIIFEEDLVANPGNNSFELPHSAVLDLQLTVTGSTNSDGTYDINDYIEVAFETNGGTLNFSQPLIGQPTNEAPWGTTFDGSSGDFNLFTGRGDLPEKSTNRYESEQGLVAIGGSTGCNWFSLCEQNGINLDGEGPIEIPIGSVMELQSMQVGASVTRAVPGLSLWSTLALGLAFLFIAGLFRRRLS